MSRFSVLRIMIAGAIDVLLGRASFYPHRKYNYHHLSFSQEGEDLLLKRIFERQSCGFYVDIGSHHPQRFSNTYLFYLCGWRGINIDPLPGCKERFDLLRALDLNLEIGVANETGLLTYFSFEEPALNTFDSEVARDRACSLLEKREISVYPLRTILDKHLPPGVVIDFMSIDVEGLDLAVLRSNDWSRFRPRYILAEALGMCDVRDVMQSEIHAYMELVGYSFYAKTVNTLFFIDTDTSLGESNP